MSEKSHGGAGRPSFTDASFDGHPEPEQIAAWVDEPEFLVPEERRRLEVHVADCPECQQVAADLRAIVAVLATLAEIEPPRSFALPEAERTRETPRLVQMTETRAWRERQLRATRWATAIAAILLVLVLGADLVTGNGGSSQSTSEAATMQLKSVPMSAAGGAAGELTDSSAAGGAAQERTTGDQAATPENDMETFGFGAAATPASGTSAESGSTLEDGASESAGAVVATPDADALTAAQDSSLQVSEQSNEPEHDRLRLVEVGLAMLIVWLLIAMIAIPYVRRQGGNSR